MSPFALKPCRNLNIIINRDLKIILLPINYFWELILVFIFSVKITHLFEYVYYISFEFGCYQSLSDNG